MVGQVCKVYSLLAIVDFSYSKVVYLEELNLEASGNKKYSKNSWTFQEWYIQRGTMFFYLFN